MPASRSVLWRIPLIYFVFVAAEFALMTHIALQATAQGRSALAVGGLATSMWTGIVLASTQAHAAVARFGHAPVFVSATAVACLAIAASATHQAFVGWAASAFVLGLGGGFVWVAGESWLAQASPSQQRGLYVGLFETAVGLGLMTGPAMVPLLRTLDVPVPVASSALMVLAWLVSLPLLKIAAPAQHAQVSGPGEAPRLDAGAARRVALPLLAIALLSGMMESGVSALLPSIAMRLGLSLDAAALLGTVIGAGSALLQPPAGHLADRLGVRNVVLLAWLVVLLANAVLLFTADDAAPYLWGIGFTLGGVGGAVYTLMIVELGNRLGGASLVKAIGWLVVAYSIGTSVSPTIGGALFDAAGLRGLAFAMLALSALGLALSGAVLGALPARPAQNLSEDRP